MNLAFITNECVYFLFQMQWVSESFSNHQSALYRISAIGLRQFSRNAKITYQVRASLIIAINEAVR